jgi:serine/threonine-protein kinase
MTPAPRIGTEFAGYRIDGLLGRGGMGVVYRAEHPRLGASIALKVMAPDLAMDEGFRERFVREARLVARIRHPNIVPIYDAGEWQGDLYIAMRYIEGDDLRALVRARGVLPLEEVCAIGVQVASALDAAHRSGVVHRDVKPGNILLDPGAEPDSPPIAYLADLGLTKRMSAENSVTSSGELVGTIDYMAPEQISGSPVDGRADVYSLACVLFECLTGSAPYVRETKAAVLWAHLNDEIPPASESHPSLPTAVDEVLARGMAKQPEDRFGTAKDLVTALSVSLARPRGRTKRARLAPGIGKRAVVLAAAVGAVLGGGVAVAAMALDAGGEAGSSSPPGGSLTITESSDTTEAAAFTPFDQALLRYAPTRTRASCRHDEPADNFDASVSCRPGGAVDSVTYSHARSGQYLYAFMAARRLKAGLPATAQRVGLCSTGDLPSVNDTAAVGWRGRAEISEAVASGELLGRILCAQTGDRVRLEWLTQEPAIYAIAKGKDIAALYEWWRNDGGPEP